MPLADFHPAVARWFTQAFDRPTEPQLAAWPAIHSGRHALIAAPTGSGKTLAAFLAAIDDLMRQGLASDLGDETQVVYVSPLKALSNDIQRNLQWPLAGIREELKHQGLADVDVRVLVRTGDTSQAARAAMKKTPPHILVTTPESLYLLLTSESGRAMLATTRSVIVDEIHAVAASKRGSHLALSLERLAALCARPIQRIGLSATQKPIEEVARFLVGASANENGNADCTIIDTGHVRRRDLALVLPDSPLEAVMANETWEQIYDRLGQLIHEHRTTLIFVNTRRLAERVTRHLSERLGRENVSTHHGSLSKEQRFAAEQNLKEGRLRVLVATASLELGIDIGEVDLVCQLGTPRSIATLLQRVGRSGHAVSGTPKGRLFPLSRDELVECAALLNAAHHGELDRLFIPDKPLDVLAQQIVAEVASREWTEDALFASFRRAFPYRNLAHADFDAVVHMLSEGFSTRRGRRSAYLHRDAVNGRLRGRKGARLTALTCGGAIPDNADYTVLLEPSGMLIGTLNEDFAIESMAGDIFQLGNSSYRILRIEAGRVRVEDARGAPPTIPFWLGEAPARTDELSHAVSRLRAEIDRRLGHVTTGSIETTKTWLRQSLALDTASAEQLTDYLAAAKGVLGVIPTQTNIVFERFFDETGGMQFVIHAPLGSRINRAWGLSLRKRFCRKFNFELQAAATEDAIVLSLGETHSFPLEEVARYLTSHGVREVLIQALLAAPMFTARWRWTTTIALAIKRFRGGRKNPPPFQRIEAEDLIAVVFPDQIACAENIQGNREIPDHPLVNQVLADCLHEAMDVDGLIRLLQTIEAGAVTIHARDLPHPSPLAQEILNARPYAFLDDAPLEERRTQAVMSRRWLDPLSATDLGQLDPAAIDEVCKEAWPEVARADELHDALMLLGCVLEAEGRGSNWTGYFNELIATQRATRLLLPDGCAIWTATEQRPMLTAVWPDAAPEHTAPVPTEFTERVWTRADAVVELLRGRLQGLGPVTARKLSEDLALSHTTIVAAQAALEQEGFVLRGRFRVGVDDEEWCERRLLARIHRYTVKTLRAEIEPVAAADFMRFLLDWQGLTTEPRPEGPRALAAVLEQLEGFEAAAVAWEGDILPTRLADYDPDWLDGLCLSGRVTWRRLTPPRSPSGKDRGAAPVRTTPIALLTRRHLKEWNALLDARLRDAPRLSPGAQAVANHIRTHGASFFDEIIAATGLLKTQAEDSLGELVAWGLVNADSYKGLRALLVPSDRRRARGPRRRRIAEFGIEEAGRWAALRPIVSPPETPDTPESETVDRVARILLARYGVVFKRLLEREGGWLPPWYELLRVFRRLEARGEIRGGRFVAGFAGEQYALPEVVSQLRAVRRRSKTDRLVSISAADPLNLVGVIVPGTRVPALAGNRVLYRDGIPIAVRVSGETSFLDKLEPGAEWGAHNALVRRNIPPALRVYLH